MPKGQVIPDEVRERVREMRLKGMSPNEIAVTLSISTKSVTKFTAPRDASQRKRVLRYVVEHGPFPVLADLRLLVPEIDDHSLMHLLYSLQSAGFVSLYSNKSGNQTRLERIHATENGRRALGNGAATTKVVPTVPVAVEDPEPVWLHEMNDQIAKVTSLSEIGDLETVAPTGEAIETVIAKITTPEPKFVAGITDMLVDAVTAAAKVTTSEPYPLVKALYEREGKIEAAAKALEAAGLDDLAIMALSKIDEITPLESEAIALYVSYKSEWDA